MQSMRRVIALGALALLLTGCPSADGNVVVTRIGLFEAVPSSVERGNEVTLLWQVEDAGTQVGMPSCTLARQVEGLAPEAPFEVACSGSLTEVPPAGAAATFVQYRLSALKSPFVAAEAVGNRQLYNCEFVAVDSSRLFSTPSRTTLYH